jgi:glycosyltransferase involved in cell wall biosynthesis
MKILLLHKQMLFPRDTGAKIRLLNLLKHLPHWHDVTFVCHIRPGEEQHIPEMEALGVRLVTVPVHESRRGSARFLVEAAANLVASNNPFTIDRHCDPALRAKVSQLLSEEQYDLLICDTPQLSRNVWGIRGVARVLFERNVEAQILERHAAVSRGRLRSAYMRKQWQRMAAFESQCGHEFDTIIAVSQKDRETFRKNYGWDNVEAIDTAVDLDYLSPRPNVEQPKRVLFLGSLDWLPNADGVLHFVKEIWPLVRTRHPDATFEIVGRNPSANLRRACDVPGVRLTGTVPDVRDHVAQAAVVVVPLLVGGGTRIKIFEAMAMQRAVVTTTLGAEGLPVTHGRHLLIADEPAVFAHAVSSLLDDAPLRREIGEAGNELVKSSFGTEAIARQFEAICVRTVERQRKRAPLACV